jgi:PAS domain S-box-containing protein
MSNPPPARVLEEPRDGSPDAEAEGHASNSTTIIASQTTTIIRAEVAEVGPEPEPLHPLLEAQLRELKLRAGGEEPDVATLARLVSQHYRSIDEERRGVVRSMQLMADEVWTLARETREIPDARDAQSGQLQVILDHIKEIVLTVNEHGVVCTFNPTGVRVFGYREDQVVGQPLELLIPQITDHGSAVIGLERLAAATGDTALDLAPREIWGRRESGDVFPAEIAVSRARIGRHDRFIVCMRDVTERRSAERHLRESEARYRMLVDHAPEAIVVLDADTNLFVDANANAERLFGLSREELLQRGPGDVSPLTQPNGVPSAHRPGYFERAVRGEPQRFEWVHRDARGRCFICEVSLLSLPSSTRRLVRGSICDISERKRAERLRDSEREVLERLAAGAPLPQVLESVTRLVEVAEVGTACSVSLLGPDGATFSTVIAPRLEPALRAVLGHALIGIRNGSCAAAVYLSRQVLVADVSKDPLWGEHREAALAAGVRAAWSTPIEAAGGKVLGALGVFRTEVGLPSEADARIIAHAVQLAEIAVERHHAEEARWRA